MTTLTHPEAPGHKADTFSIDQPVVALKRRTIDSVLISAGAVVTAAFLVAGALLMWGSNFAADYVDDELTSQNVAFPALEAMQEEADACETDACRTHVEGLFKFAGHDVNTGTEAEGYASFINGHLQGIADGATYADLGTPEREARAAVAAAKEEGASEAKIAELQATYDTVSGQRNTLFKGETLRGLLLTAYAWATVGQIAGYAAYAAFACGALMLVLVLLGLRHHHKVVVSES